MACDYNKIFQKNFSNKLNSLRKSGVSGTEFLSQALDFLKTVQDNAKSLGFLIDEEVDDMIVYINKHFERNGIPEQSSILLRDLILNPNSKIPEIKINESTTESLDVSITTKKEFRSDFLDQIFDGADFAKNRAVNLAKFNFCNALLFNRDKGTLTLSTKDLNDNIRNYQQELLDIVFNYLKNHYGKTFNRLNTHSYSIYDNEKLIMYNDGKYTGVFEELFPTASTVFNTFNGSRINLAYKLNSNTLKAFTAFQTLLHFDEFILHIFGDDIKILNMTERFIDTDKYQIAATATNMAWNNQADDDIDVSESINNITKLIVTSTRLYDWEGNIIPDSYVLFGLFINLISKLKHLAWKQTLTRNILLNSKNIKGEYEYDLSNLSQESQIYIRNLGEDATLATLINMLSEDPVNSITALFELLTTNKREQFKEITDLFNTVEKYVLMSVAKELFNNSENSLRKIQDIVGLNKETNYLNCLLLSVNGIWSVRNASIKVNQEGTTELVELFSSSVKNVQRILNDNLNLLNSFKTSRLDQEYKAGYLKGVGFTITMPLNDSLVQVKLDNIGKLYLNGNIDKNSILPFLDKVLHQNFQNNSKHLNNYITLSKIPEEEAIFDLFKFAVELVKGLYVTRQLDKAWKNRTDLNVSKEDFLKTEASKFFGKEYVPKVKFAYETIDIIPRKMIHVLETLSEATLLTNSSSASTLILDSEGKALGTSTPKRLLSNFLEWFERFRKNPEAPAHSFMIVSDPNTLLDILTIREYVNEYGESKTYNKFNTREFLESSILHDFLTPLISSSEDFSKYGLLNNNTIAFTPSVNSDKNTISKMVINIGTALQKMGYTLESFLQDKSPEKLMELINEELKTYYNKLHKKVTDDLNILSNSSTFKKVLGEDFTLVYTPESFAEFNNRLTIYNENNPNDTYSVRKLISEASVETGVKINEPIHIIFDRNKIKVNNSLLALYHRYNNNIEYLTKYNMPSASQFWKYKSLELAESLLKNKTFFDTVENKKLYNFLTKNGYNDWISTSGTLVIAKVNGVNISSVEELPQNVLDVDFQLNPLIEKYNMLDYLYSQEFILSTVGTHINHPNKKGLDIGISYEDYFKDEAARYLAQHKRNVSNTASLHPFLLNQFNGIPTQYNISILLDINDLVYTVSGKLESIKPFDGATFVNPFIVVLENNSLNGERAGIHKKQFVHFYDEELGTGGIIKTAGFGITNSWMRTSPFMERMMKNMTDVPWSFPIDITKKIQGTITSDRSIKSYNGINNKNPLNNFYFTRVINKQIHYFKVLETIKDGDGIYSQRIVEVNKKGFEIGNSFLEPISDENGPVYINSNYKVWKYIFHGLNSVSFNKEKELSNKEHFGEMSIQKTVDVINNCGYLQNGAIKVDDLNSYFLPAKYSDTHYVVTEGAIKQGTANYNTKDRYYSEGKYNSFKITMLNAGILLDKEHHADDSEISMMTLVISACAALGHTWDHANKLYNALYQLTLQGIEPIAQPLALLFAQNSPQKQFEFSKILTGLIVKLLANGSLSKDGLVYNIAYELIEKYRSGLIITDQDYINNPIPISDPMLFDKVQSLLSSTLTSSAIKMKFKGILSVLVPSHETIKLYGGKLKSDFIDFDNEINDLQALQPDLQVSQIEMGRTYIIKDSLGNIVKRVHVQAPAMKSGIYGDPNLEYVGYYDMRELYGEGYTFIEDITLGRNLGAYFCTFTGEDGLLYNFYDLESSYTMYHNLDNKDVLNYHRKKLLDLLIALSKGESVNVIINGQIKTIKPSNLNIKPYEVIMPKTMATQLGLTPEDSLDSLLNDKNVFTKKLIKNLSHKIPEDYFSVALKRVNGNHLYILTKELFEKNHPNLQEKTSYPPIIDPITNEIYAVDSEGNKLYKMSSIKDKIYTVGDKEVIVTEDLDFYLENSSYSTLYVSEKIPNFDSIINKEIKHNGFKSWKNNITHDNSGNYDRKTARLRNKLLGNIEYKDGKFVSQGIEIQGQSLDIINKLGQELYTSFKKSLDIIAARIPAQSMLSFMPMKVVGYEDFDINTAYVSTHQIFLQGSDFDIDCVSLLTYELGNDGKFIGWSPYFKLSSEEMLNISTELNYPTGKKVVEKNIQFENDEDLADYLTSLFSAFEIVYILGKPSLYIKEGENPLYFKAFVETINNISENGILAFDTLDSQTKQNIVNVFNEEFNKECNINELSIIFNDLTQKVDRHNAYIKDNKAGSFTKNYVVELMIRIAKNPSNLIQAQTSVDETTGEPKALADKYSKVGELLKKATPGNIGNKYLSIEDNHVGKEVIGISAVGLKSFFAITQYANTILRSNNPELIENLVSSPITFAGQTYHTIANINYNTVVFNKDLLTNEKILNSLRYANEKDAALMISALLSLATDNAKELCLAKLNANARMAGMYIYGLTMGIPFDTLGQLLMSDIGNTVADLLKGSIITELLKLNNVGLVIEHLENPLPNIIKIFKNKRLWEYKTGKTSSMNVWTALNHAFAEGTDRGVLLLNYDLLEGDYLKNHKPDWGKNGYLANFIELAIKNNTSMSEIVVSLKSIKKALELRLPVGKIPQNKYLILLAMDSVISAFETKLKLENAETLLWQGAFKDFKTLYYGAEELKHLGLILGANQGIKNTYIDYLTFVKNFENTILDRYKEYVKYNPPIKDFDTSLDFTEFMLNSEYRQSKILDYEKIKASFNILDVVTTVPHFFGYLMAVHTKHGSLYQGSARYRTTREYMNDLSGSLNMDKKVKSLDSLVQYKSIQNYFNLSEKYFYLPKGLDMIHLQTVSETKRIPVPVTTKIYLGTQGGNATFKNWVELLVIPDIKEGYTSNVRGIKNISVANNEFVKSLRPNTFTKNPHKNSSISHTTNINMSPRTEEDKIDLDRLILEFDALTTSYTVVDENGNKYSIPLKEIFYWYNLISYNGKQGLGTLSRIFDNYAKQGGQQFREITKLFDDSGEIYNLSEEEIIGWTSQIENPFSTYNKHIYVQNKSELKVDLAKRNPKKYTLDGDEIFEEGTRVGSYVINGSLKDLDTNLILHTPTEPDIQQWTSTIAEQSWKIVYNPVTRRFIKLESENGTKLNNLDLVLDLLKKYDPNIGKNILDIVNLTSLIEHQINCQ